MGALDGVRVLDAAEEEAEGGFQQAAAEVGVEGLGGGREGQAAGDAADGVGPFGRLGGDDGGGGHGRGRHGRVHAFADDAPDVVHDPDAGDGVGAVLDGRAEGGGDRGGLFGGKRRPVRAETGFEEVEGGDDGVPFLFGGCGGGGEVLVFVGGGGGVDVVFETLGEAVGHFWERLRWYHAVHRRRTGFFT